MFALYINYNVELDLSCGSRAVGRISSSDCRKNDCFIVAPVGLVHFSGRVKDFIAFKTTLMKVIRLIS